MRSLSFLRLKGAWGVCPLCLCWTESLVEMEDWPVCVGKQGGRATSKFNWLNKAYLHLPRDLLTPIIRLTPLTSPPVPNPALVLPLPSLLLNHSTGLASVGLMWQSFPRLLSLSFWIWLFELGQGWGISSESPGWSSGRWDGNYWQAAV